MGRAVLMLAIFMYERVSAPLGLSKALGVRPTARSSARKFGAVPEPRIASRRSLARTTSEKPVPGGRRERAIHCLLPQQSSQRHLSLMWSRLAGLAHGS